MGLLGRAAFLECGFEFEIRLDVDDLLLNDGLEFVGGA